MRKTTGGSSGYVAYLRLPFTLADKSQLTSLELSMRYDDGFVAYLNGVEVVRRNYATAGNPVFSSSATSSHSDTNSQVFEDIDITSALGNLVNGNNVLAIAGLNRATNSTDLTDFLIEPLLTATRVGNPVLGYQATPTPGAANLTASLGFVADTKFSADRGFYSSPFTVQITTDTVGAQIRYTLDSSEPTATTGLVYDPQNPILISHTTILRAAAFKTGFTPSDIDTQTYLFTSDIINQSGAGLPPYEDWGHLGADWAMDPNIVSASAANVIAGLTSIPTLSLSMPWKTLFGTGGTGIYVYGSGLEKPMSMEYFTGDGSQHFQINAGIEIQGGTSDDRWKDDKLSFRVKFESQYGDSKLDFPTIRHVAIRSRRNNVLRYADS